MHLFLIFMNYTGRRAGVLTFWQNLIIIPPPTTMAFMRRCLTAQWEPIRETTDQSFRPAHTGRSAGIFREPEIKLHERGKCTEVWVISAQEIAQECGRFPHSWHIRYRTEYCWRNPLMSALHPSIWQATTTMLG